MTKGWRFLPLLLLYAVLVLVAGMQPSAGTPPAADGQPAAGSPEFQGDEGRYVWFAENLLQGYYSPPEELNLWNGPGYPLVLAPFAAYNLSWTLARLANALFLFLAVIYFYRALCLYTDERRALAAAYLLGLYPSLMREVYLLITESLTFLLICALAYYYCLSCQLRRRRGWALAAAALVLAYLCLTKVFFGYVLLASLVVSLIAFLVTGAQLLRRTTLLLLLALAFCAPYLYYTYTLTGQPFYWGNAGGLSLYWMSSPYEGDLGDWHTVGAVYREPALAENHAATFDALAGLDPLARDRALKAQALENIRRHPAKFARNWLANLGRLLFNYPYSYTPQKLSTYYYLLPNAFLVVAMTVCLYAGWLGRRLIPGEIHALLALAVLAFGGSSLLSAYERQFRVLAPLLGLWMVVVSARVIVAGVQPSVRARRGAGAANGSGAWRPAERR